MSVNKKFGRPPIKDEDYGVSFFPLRCPRCNSKKIKCRKSTPPIRYHICHKCGHKFKSVEADNF